MKFVLLSPRRGESVLEAEYDDFLQFSGLEPDQLEQRPLDTTHAELGDFHDVTGVFVGGSPFTITDPYIVDVEPEWQSAVSNKLIALLAAAAGLENHLDQRPGQPGSISIDPIVSGIPFFSICYGASMMAQALGGKISQKYGESAGRSDVRKTLAGNTDELTKNLPAEFQVMTGHKDSIEEFPAHASLLLTGDSCPHQLYRLGEQVWVSQFHPEMDSASIARRLSHYTDNGYYDPAEREAVFQCFAEVNTDAANSLLHRFVEVAAARSRVAALS